MGSLLLSRSFVYNINNTLDSKKLKRTVINTNGSKSPLWAIVTQDNIGKCGFDILNIENNSKYLDVFLGVKPNFFTLKKVVKESVKQKCFERSLIYKYWFDNKQLDNQTTNIINYYNYIYL